MEIPVLFEKKEDCCGCGACLNVCPKQAITMVEDECGYIYPTIIDKDCIRCGRCKSVCAFQSKAMLNSPIECYAAISLNDYLRNESASGGVFASVAKSIIEEGGIVFGAAFDENWGVHHVAVDQIADLKRIQGSKYAHSNIGRSYENAKKWLDIGRKVLFSGTPCQIDGFKKYLGKQYSNLLTIDIVCHGVPSCQMLKDYVSVLEKNNGGRIERFTFRDKSIGWGINGSAEINGKKIKIWQSSSSYLYYFTRGWLYRDNCYKCKYASSHRPADITLGDYWGIEKEHPELLGKGGWDESMGISCVIVNSEKGKQILDLSCIRYVPTSFDQIATHNAQLVNPCKKGNRDQIIEAYSTQTDFFAMKPKDNKGLKQYSSLFKSLLPKSIKRIIKKNI